MLDCLNSQIGYVPTTCPCLDSVPEGFNATISNTGKYLSDLMPVDFEQNCGDSSIWNTLQRARESAKTDLINDMIKHYSATGTVKSPWTGYIGKDQGASLVNTKQYGGVRLSLTRQCRGMNATLKEIMFKTATSAEYNIKVLDRYGNQFGADQGIAIDPADINKWKSYTLSAPIKLPLWTDDSEEAQYYILWDATNVVKNESDCSNCTGTPAPYRSYFNVHGINADTFDDLPNQVTSEYFFGVRPKLTIECAFDDLICAADGQVLVSAAICLQYKWAITMIEQIINSGAIGTYTSLGGEYLEGLLSQHTFRYHENLAYLCQILYTGDCVQCSPTVKRQSIRL